jgi:hypothetical protein
MKIDIEIGCRGSGEDGEDLFVRLNALVSSLFSGLLCLPQLILMPISLSLTVSRYENIVFNSHQTARCIQNLQALFVQRQMQLVS